ncbi:catalase [Peribacillus deserti]|uniref:Catalase-related peroxidase n=1 Tax=Peribacillus deserti TaxID=673318 RepID=A0ABS2QEJ3_9BACI|nr:catalase family peroxidase [Peribacillus deserti]MBM7691455.1 catalase [Peribacillus deserti]
MDSEKLPEFHRADESIDHIEEAAGKFPGLRRAHARGNCYEGIFKPNGRAALFTDAPHLQSEEVSVIVRFSNSSSNPNHSDGLTPPKGMAVQFALPNNQITNLVCTTIPLFFARTPETFIEVTKLMSTAKKGLPDIKALQKIAAKFPESKAFFKMIKEIRLPASYAMAQYFSIHAFYFINENGKRQAVKYLWEPDAGLSMYTKKEAAKLLHNYLDEELDQRLSNGPIGFNLNIQLGKENDPTDDPTVVWPGDRQQITIGHLAIHRKMDKCPEDLFFDPTVVPRGIECSEDPILHFRHHAYAVSYDRRLKNK